jgi:hypothetical protein
MHRTVKSKSVAQHFDSYTSDNIRQMDSRSEEETVLLNEQGQSPQRTEKSSIKNFSTLLFSPICFAAIFIVGGVGNFMIFCVLWPEQDFYRTMDVRNSWTLSECMILMKACSCTCCMLEPLIPCHCPILSSKCSVYCPINDPQPPLDGNCHVPGRSIRTMDSYWKPGNPTCIMKYHNSMLVEYKDNLDQVQVASVYEVKCA